MIFGLEADFVLTDPEEGESIAVNGACLTARNIKGRRFYVDVSPESLKRTVLGRLQTGQQVNLERALRLSDRLGGHLVSGHVDGVGEVIERKPDARSERFRIHAPKELARYIAHKGSICVDGVSLTVNAVEGAVFELNIVPHTLAETTLDEIAQPPTVSEPAEFPPGTWMVSPAASKASR